MVVASSTSTNYEIIYSNHLPNITECIPGSPPYISPETILKMRNKYQLKNLERRYDNFLEKNLHILFLHELIEYYLDTRDTLIIQIQRLEREEQKKMYEEDKHIFYMVNPTIQNYQNNPYEYDHTFQHLLPKELRLTPIQILQGYMPYPNEPKEYKCGCLSMKYYSPCACKKKQPICQEVNCNEKLYSNIKLHSYCKSHGQLVAIQTKLETELTKIKKELTSIKRSSNSLDCEDYKNSLSKNPIPKRISRFPWKNIV
jgi:hypothetical protein